MKIPFFGNSWHHLRGCNWLKPGSTRILIHDESKTYRVDQISCKKSLQGSHLLWKSVFWLLWMFLTPSLRLFLTYIGVSSYLDTCLVQNFRILLFFIQQKSYPIFLREIAGVIITMFWVWLIFRQPCQWESVDVWKHSERYADLNHLWVGWNKIHFYELASRNWARAFEHIVVY